MDRLRLPWSDLPVDVLIDVFSTLEIVDLSRVSAVCSSFRQAVSLLRSERRHDPPWILLNTTDGETLVSCDSESKTSGHESQSPESVVTSFYNLTRKKIFNIRVPWPWRAWHTISSSHGWLVVADEQSNLHLINPLNGTDISLPPTKTLNFTPDFDKESGWISMSPDEDEEDQLWRKCLKVALSCSPTEDDFTAVLIHKPQMRISFAGKGDMCWTLLDTDSYMDCVYRERLLYAVTETGGIYAWDLTDGKSPTCEAIILGIDQCDEDDEGEEGLIHEILMPKQLVLAPWGDIILVKMEFDLMYMPCRCDSVLQINAYKLDIEIKELLEVQEFGDFALFSGENSGFFSAKNSLNLRPSCIYFIRHYRRCEYHSEKIRAYDLCQKKLEYLPLHNLSPDVKPLLFLTPNQSSVHNS